MITDSKDKNNNRKRNRKNSTTTTLPKSLGTIVNIATTSSSNTMSPTGTSLIVIPISIGLACGLTISNKIIYERVMQKYIQYKKSYRKDQQITKPFDKLDRKSLLDILIDENERQSPCNFFTK